MSKSNMPCAWITRPKDRGRRSIKNGKVYLRNGDEFEIEIFNPLQKTVKADVYINGNPATNGGLIVRPGRRQYLDCFTSTRKKFTFNTYTVEDTPESKKAIEKNGSVEVFFYVENQNNYQDWYQYDWNQRFKTYPTYDPTYPYYSPTAGTGGTCGSYGSQGIGSSGPGSNLSGSGPRDWASTTNSHEYPVSVNYSSTRSRKLKSSQSDGINFKSESIETGRIEGGESSNQRFRTIDMDFETLSVCSVSYQILPESIEPIEVSEIKKKFCTDCGRKLKESFKFCPDCGEVI